MTRLVWNDVGERLFEAGVDRGVLYVEGSEGVPWNGLIAVRESPSGGSVTSRYIDGIKYLDEVDSEEFQATIESYTYPVEFEQCDGTLSMGNGLFATQQPRKSFGLSYRTKLGNDVKGVDLGYKIHLVYGATAAPTNRPNNTIAEEVEPYNFSWDLVTKPPVFTGHKPTSHFVIDSRETPSELLNQLEDILYGNDEDPPRMPSIAELYFTFTQYEATIFDAGHLGEEYFATIDAGHISEEQTDELDGGGP